MTSRTTNHAHEQFQQWRRSNPGGFFINCKTRTTWMLHRVDCEHLVNTTWKQDGVGSLTKQKKICSTVSFELLMFANQQPGVRFTKCADCKP